MKNRFLLWLLMAFLASCLFSCTHNPPVQRGPDAQNRYLIRNVKAFTAVPDRPVLEDADVYIHGRTIAGISEERLDVPGAEVIEGRVRTLLPGLVDFHTHITGCTIVPWGDFMPTERLNFEGCLYSGVTAVVDINGRSLPEMKGCPV